MRTRPHCTRPTANSTRFFFSPPVRVALTESHPALASSLLSLYAPSFPSLLIPAPSFSRSSRRSPFGQDLGQPSQWPSLELDFRKDFLRAPSHLPGTLPCVAFTKYDERATRARERKSKKRDSSSIVRRLEENPTRLIEREGRSVGPESTSLNRTDATETRKSHGTFFAIERRFRRT